MTFAYVIELKDKIIDIVGTEKKAAEAVARHFGLDYTKTLATLVQTYKVVEEAYFVFLENDEDHFVYVTKWPLKEKDVEAAKKRRQERRQSIRLADLTASEATAGRPQSEWTDADYSINDLRRAAENLLTERSSDDPVVELLDAIVSHLEILHPPATPPS